MQVQHACGSMCGIVPSVDSAVSCALHRLYDDNLAAYGKVYFYYIWELPVFVLIGVLSGVLGAAFIQANMALTRLRARYVPPRRPHLRLAEVCLCCLPFTCISSRTRTLKGQQLQTSAYVRRLQIC